MPQNASWALQKAIYQALMGDVVLNALLGMGKIFDDVPQGEALPYITIGQATAHDWSTATDEGLEHILTLQVWSKNSGRKGIQAIMQALHDILHDAVLPLEDHQLINLRHEFTDFNRVKDGEAYHGLTRYRAVTELST